MKSILNAITLGNFTTSNVPAIFIIMLLFESSIALPMSIYSVKTCAQQQSSLAGTTLPPTIFYKLRSIPSYVITIPFSSSGFSNFDPADVSIPLGMTVIWFNDDNSLHSVTTTNNTAIIVKSGSLYSSYSTAPPQRIDSAPIPTNGGSFIHTFSKPGTYNYYDKFDPRMHGTINVGSAIEPGKNMNMIIAANTLSFNPDESRRIVLSFIPKAVSIPPTIALTYQVTISNTIRPWLVFSHMYDDADGILDFELIPTHRSISNFTDYTTWGPDFRNQGALHTTGVYHLKGPILVENSTYDIRIAITARDGTVLSKPVLDTFVLLPGKVIGIS